MYKQKNNYNIKQSFKQLQYQTIFQVKKQPQKHPFFNKQTITKQNYNIQTITYKLLQKLLQKTTYKTMFCSIHISKSAFKIVQCRYYYMLVN